MHPRPPLGSTLLRASLRAPLVVGLFALLYGSGVTGLLEPIRDEVRLVVPGAPGWGPLLVSVLLLSGVLSLL